MTQMASTSRSWLLFEMNSEFLSLLSPNLSPTLSTSLFLYFYFVYCVFFSLDHMFCEENLHSLRIGYNIIFRSQRPDLILYLTTLFEGFCKQVTTRCLKLINGCVLFALFGLYACSYKTARYWTSHMCRVATGSKLQKTKIVIRLRLV